MQLIYAGAIAIVAGFALHAMLPSREWSGVLLLPAVAGSACAVVWVVLTWSGVEEGGAVMWSVSLTCALLSAAGLGVPLRRSRRRAEEQRLAAA